MHIVQNILNPLKEPNKILKTLKLIRDDKKNIIL